ncbi:tRNA 2-thiocytidine(32) synthetase TtcA [Myxococcota bacterium]|nr:tRNA 2-thiocytidine(32) synthetase TtcA [Myxococcota bacterium]MBU1900695.1 tRNA 2-thiocytidine(32) synthetase TtcA [Myxococcota bacterium]
MPPPTPFEKLRRRLNRQIQRALIDYQLLKEGDRVMVAVSGGKDSYTLLEMLHRARARAPFGYEILAVHLDQGQPGYMGAPLEAWLRASAIPHEIIRVNTFEIVERLVKPGEPQCAPCARLRRGVLYTHAERLGCNKIALGHHADDAIETLLLNLFFSGRLQAMPPRYITEDERYEVIRPMILCAEADIAAYAAARAFPILPCGLCKAPGAQRAKVKALLNQLEGEIPDVRAVMLAGLQRAHPKTLLDPRFLDPLKAGDSPQGVELA